MTLSCCLFNVCHMYLDGLFYCFWFEVGLKFPFIYLSCCLILIMSLALCVGGQLMSKDVEIYLQSLLKDRGVFFVCVHLILVINSLTSHYFNWLYPVGFSDTTSLASIILILLTALHHMVCKDVIEHCLLMIYLIILFIFCAIWLTTA